jgi:hypothetical protein
LSIAVPRGIELAAGKSTSNAIDGRSHVAGRSAGKFDGLRASADAVIATTAKPILRNIVLL